MFDILVQAHPRTQYNIASLLDLPIRRTFPAAAYTEAKKKLLDRRCTMDDVAEFVTDYINADVRAFFTEVCYRLTFHRCWDWSRLIG